MKELRVFLAGSRIGTLVGGPRTTFTYIDGYHGTPLSLSMPTDVREHSGRAIMHWLDGLLPGSVSVRERWARKFNVSARNPVALLAHVDSRAPRCPTNEARSHPPAEPTNLGNPGNQTDPDP